MKTFATPTAPLPRHFLATDGGTLFNLRTNKETRSYFSRHCREIETCTDLKATLRAGRHTSLGCYPLFFITSDGAALSFDSVRENLRSVLDSIKTKSNDGWRVVACEVNWEDAELCCEHSGKRIPSAYAGE